MPFLDLSLKTLDELDDGRAALAFVHELKRCVLDCMDRPGETAARKAALVFVIKPVIGEDGTCDLCTGRFQIKSTTPERKSKDYTFRVNKKGALIFSVESPENPDQTTFNDLDENGRVSR